MIFLNFIKFGFSILITTFSTVVEIKKSQPFFLFLFYPFLFLNTSIAQIVVSAEIDSSTMLIGDQMSLHLLVNHSKDISGLTLETKIFKKTKIEVLGESSWDTLNQGVESILQKDIFFTIWDSGKVVIPKFPINYIQDGKPEIVYTNELLLDVNTPKTDSTLSPIKDIILEPRTFEDFIPALATISGFILLSAIVYFFWKRKDKKEELEQPAIILPAHEIALNKLQALKTKQLWQKGDIKNYQIELTHVIREYLENRFEIQALENATEEILDLLKSVDFSDDWKEKIKEMLQMADLVKFAKANPGSEFHEKMMTYAESFVEQTKKVEIENTDLLND